MNYKKRECGRCDTGKKFTIDEWHDCPWQQADTKAATKWCFLPRFVTYWWYFRNKPQHLLLTKSKKI